MKLLHFRRVNWATESSARGFEPPLCGTCHGRGILSFPATYSHPQESTETCLDCCGTGSEYGECPCGHVGPLVVLDRMLICQRCAAACSSCGERLSVVSEIEDRDPLCLGCYAEFVAELAVAAE